MQSPKFSFAGWPRALPNLSNALDAAPAISRLNGIIIPGPASIKCSSHSDERVVRLTEHQRRVSTQRGGADCAFVALKKIEESARVWLAADNFDQDGTVEHDHSGSPVSSL